MSDRVTIFNEGELSIDKVPAREDPGATHYLEFFHKGDRIEREDFIVLVRVVQMMTSAVGQ